MGRMLNEVVIMKKKRREGSGDIDEAMFRMHEELDKMFAGFLESTKPLIVYGGKQLQKWAEYRPAVANVYETENSVIATFEMPGVDKNDIDLKVDEGSIEVQVKSKAEKEEKRKGYYAYAARAKSFYRKMPLPTEVIAEKAEAEFKNGVLRVELPKAKAGKKEKKGRKIDVR